MEFDLIGLLQMPTPTITASFGGYPGPTDGRALWQDLVFWAMMLFYGSLVFIPVLYIIFAKRNDENS